MASAHVGRKPRDRASAQRKAYSLSFWRLSPLPARFWVSISQFTLLQCRKEEHAFLSCDLRLPESPRTPLPPSRNLNVGGPRCAECDGAVPLGGPRCKPCGTDVPKSRTSHGRENAADWMRLSIGDSQS
ncbi:hypothetical protein NN561_009194 [Cricetulus griseus]